MNRDDQSLLITGSASTGAPLKVLEVVVGVVVNENGELLLSYRPDFMPQGGYWEFAGGFVEDETFEAAVHREMSEELGIEVKKASELIRISYMLDQVQINLNAWLIERYCGEPVGMEGQKVKWFAVDSIQDTDLTRPNRSILRHYTKTVLAAHDPSSVCRRYSDLDLEVLRWEDVRDEVYLRNPKLAEVIDQDSPDRSFKLVKANYQFGDYVTRQGKFCLPALDGGSVNLQADSVSSRLQQLLSYSPIPLGFVLQGATETCFENNHHLIPVISCYTGNLLGLLTSVSAIEFGVTSNIVNVYAGMRSAFMLPKISDQLAHKRLTKALGIQSPAPKTPLEHFDLFRQIAQARSASEQTAPWKTSILFFASSWLENNSDNHSLPNLQNYLHKGAVQNYHVLEYKLILDTFWHFFIEQLNLKHKKPPSHVLDTVRHILGVLLGIRPGLSVVSDNQMLGPFEFIQQVYCDLYQISQVPTIMGASYVQRLEDGRPVYHSMRMPMALESYPRSKAQESLLTDLVQVQSVLNDFYNMALTGKLNIDGTKLENVLRRSRLDYFHANPEKDSYYHVHDTASLPQQDPALLCHPCNSDLKFAEMSSLLRCCVRIINKNNK